MWEAKKEKKNTQQRLVAVVIAETCIQRKMTHINRRHCLCASFCYAVRYSTVNYFTPSLSDEGLQFCRFRLLVSKAFWSLMEDLEYLLLTNMKAEQGWAVRHPMGSVHAERCSGSFWERGHSWVAEHILGMQKFSSSVSGEQLESVTARWANGLTLGFLWLENKEICWELVSATEEWMHAELNYKDMVNRLCCQAPALHIKIQKQEANGNRLQNYVPTAQDIHLF